jgi:hypothetical protein
MGVDGGLWLKIFISPQSSDRGLKLKILIEIIK